MQTCLATGPTGDVCVMDNWQTIANCFGDPVEALSTNRGGQGITIFHGMARPVRTADRAGTGAIAASKAITAA